MIEDRPTFAVHGHCDDRFAGVREAFTGNFERGDDVGASVCVTIDGEAVVDLWGGWADAERTRPWERDTIVTVYSTTKTMTALSALLLADKGELDFSAPVAKYWPEFAAAGKAGVEVRHLLGHTSGLAGWDAKIAFEDLYDWDKVTGLLAAQAPWWEPGTASGYHAITQGFLVGEVVRRITGQTLGTFFAQEIARPLGGDFHIGLAAAHDHRVATVIPPAVPEAGMGTEIGRRLIDNPPLPRERMWEEGWRRSEIPAGNGIGNARSIAGIQSLVACGGEVGGVRLMSPEGCAAVLSQQSNGPDLVFVAPVRFGLGYALSLFGMPFGDRRVAFWGGSGGSLIVVDFDARMTIAYAMNQLEGSPFGDRRNAGLVKAAYAAVDAG